MPNFKSKGLCPTVRGHSICLVSNSSIDIVHGFRLRAPTKKSPCPDSIATNASGVAARYNSNAFIGTTGIFNPIANPFAYAMPTRMPVKLPGPTTTPIAEMPDHVKPHSVMNFSVSIGNATDCFSADTHLYLSPRTNSRLLPDVFII